MFSLKNLARKGLTYEFEIVLLFVHLSLCGLMMPNGNGLLPVRCQDITGTHANLLLITLTPFMVLPLFATRFADYAVGTRVSFIQPSLF